jgi:small subunit ribosomal protein S14
MAKTSMVVKNNRKKNAPIQYRRRCNICGRPRAFMRKFGLCRLCFRKLAYEGKLPGVVKSSW